MTSNTWIWTRSLIILSMLGWSITHAQVAWTQCAAEGGTCTLATQRSVRYGEPFNDRWTTPRTVVGTFTCGSAYFGTDPSPGTGKRCETQDLPIATPPVATAQTVLWCPSTVVAGSAEATCQGPQTIAWGFTATWTWVLTPDRGWQRRSDIVTPTAYPFVTAPPPPPPPPPPSAAPALATSLVWGTRMDLTWTAPTTNTNGSAVCGPLTYRVRVDGVEKAIVSAAAYTVTGVAPGARCATVSTIGSCGESVASAQACTTVTTVPPLPKPCWGKTKGGAGTTEKLDWNASGYAVYWQCQTAGVWIHEGFVGYWRDLDSDWGPQLAAADTDAKRNALWIAKANLNTLAYYDGVRPLYDALQAANPFPTVTPPPPPPPPPPPAATWKVAPNGTATSRPATAIVSGARTLTVAGRVAIGRPCDCVAHSSGTAPNTYCAVTGQDNAATAAVDQLPASAAVCVR